MFLGTIRFFNLFCLFFTLIFFAVSNASAVTFTVNSTRDDGDVSRGDQRCRTNQNTCTLRAAIEEANALAAHGEHANVQLPTGTFVLSRGTLLIRGYISIFGSVDTTIDARGADAFSIRGGSLALEDMNIIGGRMGFRFLQPVNALDSEAPMVLSLDRVMVDNLSDYILLYHFSVTSRDSSGKLDISIRHSILSDSAKGILIRDESPDSLLTIEDSVIQRIPARALDRYSLSRTEIRRTTFADNAAGIVIGHGKFDENTGPSSLLLEDSSIVRSQSVGIRTGFSGPNIEIRRSKVANNRGGGIDQWSGMLSIYDSEIANNGTASGTYASGGGGIQMTFGFCSIVNSTIRDNKAFGVGGGIAIDAGQLEVLSSTISGNESGFSGGGIFVGKSGFAGFDLVSIRNSTIAHNIAGLNPDSWTSEIEASGGVDSQRPNSTISASIVASNFADHSTRDDCSGLISEGNNIIGNSKGCDSHRTDLVNVDVKLGPLAKNGGFGKTHALLIGSPGVDAYSCLADTDQRGVPRPQGTSCDIGAFELEQTPISCGDVNNDGRITATDALMILQMATGNLTPSESQYRAADVDSSGGDLSVTDAVMVLRAAVNLPVSLECDAFLISEALTTRADGTGKGSLTATLTSFDPRNASVRFTANAAANSRFEGFRCGDEQSGSSLSMQCVLPANASGEVVPVFSTLGCPAIPLLACNPVSRAKLDINESVPGGERLKLLLQKPIEGFRVKNLGEPDVDNTVVDLCIYDGANRLAGSLQVDRGGDRCGNGDCWRNRGGSGWIYRDRYRSSHGVSRIKLKGRGTSQTKLILSADNRSSNFGSPLPSGITQALSGKTSALVQFHSTGGLCLEAQFDQIHSNSTSRFQARKR